MKRTILAAAFLVSLGLTVGWAGDAAKSHDTYLKKAQNEVQEWTVKLKSLQERSEKSGSASRQDFDQRLKSVNEKLDSVRKNLEQLRASGVSSWKPIRHGLEDAMSDLKRDYRNAVTYFDKKETKEKS